MTRLIYATYAMVAAISATIAYTTVAESYILHMIVATVSILMISAYRPNPSNIIKEFDLLIIILLSLMVVADLGELILGGIYPIFYHGSITTCGVIIIIAIGTTYGEDKHATP